MQLRIPLFFLLALGLASCSATRKVAISSEPPGAMIQVDGRNVGVTPTAQTLDFRDKKRVLLAAVKEGYHNEQVAVDIESRSVEEGHVKLVMMEDQAWSVTTTSEATNNWMRVQVDPSHTKEDVWQKLIDSVTTRYANLEQLDDASGYVRTVNEVRNFRGPRGQYRVRTRFLCSMSSREPLIYKFKVEAEITDSYGNWVPYGRIFKEDASLIEELQDRLGLK